VSALFETAYRTEKQLEADGTVRFVRNVPTGLRVRIRTTAPAAPSFGPTVRQELWANVGACSLIFRMHVAGPRSQPDDPAQGAELRTRNEACPEGPRTYTDGISMTIQGNETVLEFPFAVFGPGIAITADVDGNGARVQTVHGLRPSSPPAEGPAIDLAAPTTTFVIGSDVPADVDCRAEPGHPACAM
jgi:hypothetical protein